VTFNESDASESITGP